MSTESAFVLLSLDSVFVVREEHNPGRGLQPAATVAVTGSATDSVADSVTVSVTATDNHVVEERASARGGAMGADDAHPARVIRDRLGESHRSQRAGFSHSIVSNLEKSESAL